MQQEMQKLFFSFLPKKRGREGDVSEGAWDEER